MKIMLTEISSSKLNSIIKSIIYWALFISLLFITGSFISPIFPGKYERFIYGIFGTISSFLAIWIVLKMENKLFSDYGLTWQRNTLLKFLKGVLIGAVIFILIIAFLLVFSEIQIERNTKSFNPLNAIWYLSIIPLALMEEVAFRSYTFLKLQRAFGLRITQVIVAIAFALYHIITGWNIQIAFAGPAIWAFVFGLAAIWSNGIALPTGIHVAINLIQQLFGMRGGDSESIWVLNHNTNASTASIAQTEMVGLISQILVLAFAILLTEFYIRKIQKTELPVL